MAKTPKKPARKGGKKNAAPKKVVLKSRQHGKSAAARKPRKFSREDLRVAELTATSVAGDVTFTATARDYGLALNLTGERTVGDYAFRSYCLLDLTEDRARAAYLKAPSHDAFLQAWVKDNAAIIANVLGGHIERHQRAPRPTVEEQFAADYAAETARRAALKPALPKPKGKFWTRFQSAKTGRFVSAAKALADKARTFGRRVLRKPAP